MKNKVKTLIVTLLVGVFVLMTFSGCSSLSGSGNETSNVTTTTNESASNVSSSNTSESVSNVSVSQSNLNSKEIEGLLYMAEEEKLARDVYTYLNNLWGLQVFANITKAEQTHMDSVLSLISKYNLQSPIKSDAIGEFTNEKIKDLYKQLTETGSKSVIDALKVGAAIEEIDIIDLNEHIKNTTSQDIISVYENLKSGSENHLRAFVSQLKNYGVTYTPQYLSQEEYNNIISGSNGNTQGNQGLGNPANSGLANRGNGKGLYGKGSN